MGKVILPVGNFRLEPFSVLIIFVSFLFFLLVILLIFFPNFLFYIFVILSFSIFIWLMYYLHKINKLQNLIAGKDNESGNESFDKDKNFLLDLEVWHGSKAGGKTVEDLLSNSAFINRFNRVNVNYIGEYFAKKNKKKKNKSKYIHFQLFFFGCKEEG